MSGQSHSSLTKEKKMGSFLCLFVFWPITNPIRYPDILQCVSTEDSVEDFRESFFHLSLSSSKLQYIKINKHQHPTWSRVHVLRIYLAYIWLVSSSVGDIWVYCGNKCLLHDLKKESVNIRILLIGCSRFSQCLHSISQRWAWCLLAKTKIASFAKLKSIFLYIWTHSVELILWEVYIRNNHCIG